MKENKQKELWDVVLITLVLRVIYYFDEPLSYFTAFTIIFVILFNLGVMGGNLYSERMKAQKESLDNIAKILEGK